MSKVDEDDEEKTDAKRQTDRQTERQIEDKTTFQPSYQNKGCSECQEDVRKIVRQAKRKTEWQISSAAKETALVRERHLSDLHLLRSLSSTALLMFLYASLGELFPAQPTSCVSRCCCSPGDFPLLGNVFSSILLHHILLILKLCVRNFSRRVQLLFLYYRWLVTYNTGCPKLGKPPKK